MKIENLVNIVLVLFIALTVSGTRGCQEDYNFADQSAVSPSGSATETATPTATSDEDDDDTISISPSPSPSPSSSASATVTPSTTPSASASASASATPITVSATGRTRNKKISDENSQSGAVNLLTGNNSERTTPENWLGKSYAEDDLVSATADSDGDGYTDLLETDFGSDPADASSTPPAPVSNLALRLRGIDDDVDGLKNDEELTIGTSADKLDSDGDGVSDGAETLSGSDPLNNKDLPADRDGDGLSDQYESSFGTNPASPDSDNDLLRDDVEIAIGSDPLNPDSDSDGILDGTEVRLGGDPTRAEFQ